MSEKQYTVFTSEGQAFENIFVALGFSDEEAARFMAEADEKIDLEKRRDRLFRAVAGKRKKVGNRRSFPARA